MSENKLGYNQASKYCEAISTVFYSVRESDKPADRELRNFFSANRQCGSKDRRFISEGLYALFRWYGWLKRILPSDKPLTPIEDSGFRLALIISLNLEEFVSSLAYKALCELGNYETHDFPEELCEKAKFLKSIVGDDISVEDLVPEWFLKDNQNLEQLFFTALQKRPPVWLRAQRNGLTELISELKAKSLSYETCDKVANSVKILDKANLVEFKTFRKGLFEIQDLASQCLVKVCSVAQGEKWWDVCAGAGGKTLAIADQLKGQGKIIATDKRKNVLQELKKRAQRAGFRSIQVANLPKELKSTESYDGILVDAPCSCTGTWRRNPDARWKSNENICQEWSRVQLQILNEVCSKVKVGGKLVYATCSVSEIENEQVVTKFLEGNAEFELESVLHPLNGEVTDGMVRVEALPEDCDSMFAARMIRKKK